MLILTRKISEKIMMGDDIIVTVLGINGSRVRIGIDAPDDVKILRSEIAYNYIKGFDYDEDKFNK